MSLRSKTTTQLFVMAVLLTVAFVTTARADIINVPRDFLTIQEAIDMAMNGDEVVVAPGTYNEVIDFLGKAIIVRSTDGPDVTIIDARQTGTVVTCDSDEGPGSVLEGFTITNGSAGLGGGMRNANSSPTVTNCTFSGNVGAFGGGGMANSGGSPTVTNCTFSENTASFSGGGGMFNTNGSPTVTNCTFNGNSGSFNGGGMFNFSGSPTVTNCTFSGNDAFFGGGGMSNDGSNPTVTNCSFIGNTVVFVGGGMYNDNSSPTVTNCSFSGNTADDVSGGGMKNDDSNPTVTNCTFSGNAASTGGGMCNQNSSPTVTNCTFSGNSITGFFGTGGMCNSNSTTTVTNCVFWDNSPNEFQNDGGMVTVTYSDVQGGFAGTGNIDADPMFVNPDNDDYHLSSGSPCIDAADNTAVPRGIDTDLEGNPRFVDDPDTEDTGNGDPPIVDMGAYEFQVTVCPWDVNGDGVVDHHDLVEVVHNLGRCDDPDDCPWDVNGDGIVNGRDVAAVAMHFGPCP